MGIADWFKGRKESSPAEQIVDLRCHTCDALRMTISVMQEEIEFLRSQLEKEQERNKPQVQVSAPVIGEPKPVRLTRTPWVKTQAKLERASELQARANDQALWDARVKAAEAADKTDATRPPNSVPVVS